MGRTGRVAMPLKALARRFALAFCSVFALAAVTDAETLNYGFDAGLGESDNIGLVPAHKVSQTIATADVDFDVKHQSRRLDVDAKGDFTFLDYLQGAYGSQVLGRFDGVAHVALIPQRLTWVLQDDFGQAALDPFTPTTPSNVESINYVSTGPDLALRVGGAGFVDAGLRVARAQYATSPFNSNRVLGSFAAGLQLSARSSVSLNALAERVLFDDTNINSNFNRTTGFVHYEVHGARTDLSADLGATHVSQTAASTTGPHARLAVARKLSPAATVTLSGGRELTDASTSFSGLQSGAIGVVGTAPAVLTANSYTDNFASVGWQYLRGRTSVGVTGRWEKDVYASQPQLDLTRGSAEFSVERKLTRALSAQLFGRYSKYDYVHATNLVPLNGSSSYSDRLIAAVVKWRHGRALEVRLRFEHTSRTTTGTNNGFQENRAFLTIGYRPGPQGTHEIPGGNP